MIVSFRHKGLETFYRSGSTRGIQGSHAAKLKRMPAALDVSTGPDELRLPGCRLDGLKGKWAGRWSIWVNGNWRLTFRFHGVNVELVGYQNYH